MNPTVAQPALHRPVMDVARPRPLMTSRRVHPAAVPARPFPAHPNPVSAAPAAVPVPIAAPTAPSGISATNIVSDIPLRAPAPALAANEDDELDKIMRDVGHELKQADRAHTKKHFSLFGHKRTKPAPRAMAAPKMAQVVDVKPAAQAQQPTVQPAKPVVARAQKSSPAPIGIVLVTLLVTTFLIAAAFYSYK